MRKLKYVGPGFVPGVPAADHDCEDDELAAALIAGGAYENYEESKDEKRARQQLAAAAKAEANASAAAAAKAEADRKAEEARAAADAQAEAERRRTSSIAAARKNLEAADAQG